MSPWGKKIKEKAERIREEGERLEALIIARSEEYLKALGLDTKDLKNLEPGFPVRLPVGEGLVLDLVNRYLCGAWKHVVVVKGEAPQEEWEDQARSEEIHREIIEELESGDPDEPQGDEESHEEEERD